MASVSAAIRWTRCREDRVSGGVGADKLGESCLGLRLSIDVPKNTASVPNRIMAVAVAAQGQNPICCQLDERRSSNLVDPMVGRIDSPKGEVQSVRSDERCKGLAVAFNSERIFCGESQQTLFVKTMVGSSTGLLAGYSFRKNQQDPGCSTAAPTAHRDLDFLAPTHSVHPRNSLWPHGASLALYLRGIRNCFSIDVAVDQPLVPSSGWESLGLPRSAYNNRTLLDCSHRISEHPTSRPIVSAGSAALCCPRWGHY